jgi:uncharacterized protein
MKGERLDTADVRFDGIAGDRRALIVRNNRIITSRTHPRLLAHSGTIAPDGEPRVDGKRWDDPAVGDLVKEIAGESAKLIRWDGPERFDILPLLVATDGAITTLGIDHRRMRPNIVVGGVEGLAERGWEGRQLRIGTLVIQLADLRGRCVMTTFDPDTQEQDLSILRRFATEFDGTFCLNAGVAAEGVIRIGDEVILS